MVNKDRKTALDIAIDVYDAQEKKVELAPSHSELRMLLETGKGLDAPQATTNRTKPKSISRSRLRPSALLNADATCHQ